MKGTQQEMLTIIRRIKQQLDTAERALSTAFSIEHAPADYRGTWDYRTNIPDGKGKLEAALVAAWRDENGRSFNESGKILKHLMTVECCGDSIYIEPTQRDATVTTALIQWLGTNCGIAFLTEAFSKGGFNLQVTEKRQ